MLSKIIIFLKNRSLVFKLSASILLSVVAGSILLSLFVSNYSKPLLKEQVISQAFKAIGEINYDLAQGANVVEQSIVNTANLLSMKKTITDDELLMLSKAALESIEEQYGFFFEFWIYTKPENKNEKGILYYSTVKNGKIHTVKWNEEDFMKDREWLNTAMRYGKIHWCEPYMSIDPENNPVLSSTVSMPFKFKGSNKWNGVIAASGNLEAFRQKMEDYKFESFGKFLMTSAKGLYIIHPDKNVEMKKTIYELAKEIKSPKLEFAANQVSTGHTGFVVMKNSSVYDGDVVFVYMPVPKTNWCSFIVYSPDSFYEPIRHFQIILISVIIIGLLCLIFLINWICKLTTNPIVELSIVANKYGQGEFSAELPEIKSNDEVGILTHAFYNMKENLLKLIQQQKETAKNEQKLASELEISTKIQASALPVNFPEKQNFKMYASMLPAKEVGGDFYDFFFIDENHFAFLIADVSGKGIPAALFMMNAKAILKSNIKSGCPLNIAVERTNNELCSTNNAKMFITAFIAVLDTITGEVEYVNAGHNPPLIKKDGKYEYLKSNTNIVLSAIENFQYESDKIQLNKDDGIFLYTDGIVEAQNINSELYGEKRLYDTINKEALEPIELLKTIKENVAEFTGTAPQFDDITMLNIIR